MRTDVEAALRALNKMTIGQLRDRYAEVFGEKTRSFNRQHLIRRIVWRLQAIREGGLSERAKRRAMELANDADLRVIPPRVKATGDGPTTCVTLPIVVPRDGRLPAAGTMLRRVYKGQSIHVRVLTKGFEYDGEVYRSLTAIARKVTGAQWNGFHFFGLAAANPKAEVAS